MKRLLPLMLCLFSALDASAQAGPPPEYVVVVGAGSPYETIGELIRVGRGAEKGLMCGAGRGTPGCGAFAKFTGAKVDTVLYKASGAVANDLAGSQLDVGLLTLEDAKEWIAKRKVKALAVAAPVSPLPGVPTLMEGGLR